MDRSHYRPKPFPDGSVPSFDLVRAGVNLMVASALVSWATSMKLPLSTTYVTFMVAMGTSLADQAWGLESAVYRVTGVLTVIGGWFFTAMMAFTVSSIFATAIFFGGGWAVAAILLLAAFIIYRTHHIHRKREAVEDSTEVFNLRKIKDSKAAIEEIKSCAIKPLKGLVQHYLDGNILREGLKVAVVGRPNVGKSSLLNRLLQKDRAIVTSVPGTTRDTIEETLSIKGFPVILADTAGLHDTNDPVETLGIEKTMKNIEDADLIVFMVEAHRSLTKEDYKILNKEFRKIEKI